jgi:hypothetical protein
MVARSEGLVDVLRKAGEHEEATTAAREALELNERKGDLPDASKARTKVEALSTS